MAGFKLIVDSLFAERFTHLAAPQPLTHSGFAFTLFEWSAPALSDLVREHVLSITQKSRTAFILPVKPWKAIFFDMDSTVIGQESIVELARAAGKEAEVSEITERAMAGLLDFEGALRQRVAMLKDLPDTIIHDVAQRLTINPGMRELAEAAHNRGIKLFLVSGGFDTLAAGIASSLGFAGSKANTLELRAGKLTGGLLGEIVDAQAKARFLEATCAKFGWNLDEVLAVGDGANDLKMMEKAGGSLGYHPKAVLLPHISGASFNDHRAFIFGL